MDVQSRKVKGAGIVLALMFIALIATLFIPLPYTTDCTKTVFSELISPDAERSASISHHICRATKSSEVMVDISTTERSRHSTSAFCAPVPFDSEYSPRTVPLSAKWIANKELVVTYRSDLVSSCSSDGQIMGVRILLDQSKPK